MNRVTAIERRYLHVVSILVLLLVTAVVEIGVLVLVGQAIGVLPTIGLLIAGAVIGGWMLRREGRRTLHEFREAARLRRPPERELSDGVLIALAGLFVLLPGLVSDVAGLLLLVPFVRTLLRRKMLRLAERRSQQFQEQMRAAQSQAQGGGSTRRAGSGAGEDVIDGEVVSVSEDDEPDHGSDPHVLPPQNGGKRGPMGGPRPRPEA